MVRKDSLDGNIDRTFAGFRSNLGAVASTSYDRSDTGRI